jgi:hypothetical protein
LIKAYPESPLEQDASGKLPPHRAVITWTYGDADRDEDEPWDAYEIITMMMVYHCPAAVQYVTDNDGKIPPQDSVKDYEGNQEDADAIVTPLKDPSTGGCKADSDAMNSRNEEIIEEDEE